MQDILCRNSLLPDATFGKGHIFRNFRIQMVADHQHIQMFVYRIDRKGTGWVG